MKMKRPELLRYEKTEDMKLHTGSESKVQQHFKDEVDINKMIKKYKKTGLMRGISPDKMRFGDFSNVPDYMTLRNKVINIEQLFMKYPSEVRARFDNDASKFVEFMQNSDNFAEAVKLGIVDRDVSTLRYFNESGADITDQVFAAGRVKVDGKAVNRDGTPWKKKEETGEK